MASDETRRVVVRVVNLEECDDYVRLLSAAELEKAEAMRNETLRARFVVSRGLRREMLARATGRAAGELQFVEKEEGKPRLMDAAGWDFNVSHAGDYVAVVLAREPVGIDLEEIRPVREMPVLMRRYFHADEVRAWEELAEQAKEEGFFALWSAREAAMKCCGLGLAQGLAATRVDPEFLHRPTARVVVGDEVVEVEKFDAPRGYVTAVGRKTG